MAIYNGPPRGGSRGGRDQFNWEDVKGDKEREYYLGHSVKALAGRWQKGKDVYWYTRAKATAAVDSDEVQAVKQQEEQLMAEALGYKPQASHSSRNRLEQHEMNRLLERSKSDDAEGMTSKGLGFAPRSMGGMAAQERLPATGLEEDRQPRREHECTAAEHGEPDTDRKRRRTDYDEGGRSHEHSKKRKEDKEHKHKKSKEHKHKKSKEHKEHKHKKGKEHKEHMHRR